MIAIFKFCQSGVLPMGRYKCLVLWADPRRKTTYHEVLNSIHPHPTVSESVKDAIEVAYGEAIHL